MFPQFDDDKGEGKQRDQLPVPAPLVLDSQWILNFKFAFKFEGEGNDSTNCTSNVARPASRLRSLTFEWTVITLKDIQIFGAPIQVQFFKTFQNLLYEQDEDPPVKDPSEDALEILQKGLFYFVSLTLGERDSTWI